METFIKIGLFVWAVEMTHTHGQTDTHLHTLGSNATYLVKMTEYKKKHDLYDTLRNLIYQKNAEFYCKFRSINDEENISINIKIT